MSLSLPEPLKRFVDAAALLAPTVSLASLQLVLSIVLTLLGIGWYAVRFHDRFIKKLPPSGD